MIARRLALVAALLVPALPVVVLGPSPAVAAPSPERERELTAQYQRAQDHYLAKRYTEALPLFEEVSRELGSPNAQLYVARCHRQLGHVVEAHGAMTETVRMATARAEAEPRFATTRDEATKELAELEALVGRVVVDLADPPDGLVVEVAGRPVALGEEVVVAPGRIRVDALVPGRPLHRRAIDAQAGARIAVPLTLPEPPPSTAATPSTEALPSTGTSPSTAPTPPAPPSPGASGAGADREAGSTSSGGGVRIAGYVLLGASAAGFVTFAVSGIMANQRFSDIERACGGPCTDPSYDDEIDGGRTMDLVANVGLGVGLGLGVAGALMVIFGGADDEPENVSLHATPAPGGGLLGVAGRF